ncbi:hypothetical protein NDU88_002219 [Pleurodeles waltl]|uniref:Uncharacterized protein n=1 Tax=Pleurodeles waltl TaxID=8319 RepID=A0AAV7NFR3_PLEWA|nr:hypothetical protein NDU88_002219 [Pleurodeles waltl]
MHAAARNAAECMPFVFLLLSLLCLSFALLSQTALQRMPALLLASSSGCQCCWSCSVEPKLQLHSWKRGRVALCGRTDARSFTNNLESPKLVLLGENLSTLVGMVPPRGWGSFCTPAMLDGPTEEAALQDTWSRRPAGRSHARRFRKLVAAPGAGRRNWPQSGHRRTGVLGCVAQEPGPSWRHELACPGGRR